MSLNSALMFNHPADRLADVARIGHWLQTQPVNERSQSWWLWLLLFIILILFVWWLLHNESIQQSVQQSTAQPARPKAPVTVAPVAAVKAPVSPSTPVPAAPIALPIAASVPATMAEDLTKIEGIGPKINGVLHAAGIKTFVALSKAEVRQLRQILVGVGMKVNDPTTWPEQAALAATGKWAELQKLQEQLNGGRRV